MYEDGEEFEEEEVLEEAVEDAEEVALLNEDGTPMRGEEILMSAIRETPAEDAEEAEVEVYGEEAEAELVE